MGSQSIIFVGPISGFYSPNVVCKGLIRALALNNISIFAGDTTWDGSFDHSIDHYNAIKGNIEWLDRHDLSDLILKGKVAERYGNICIAINPNDVKAPFFGLQEQGVKIVGMHVGDVDAFPDRIKLIMEKEDMILTPSYWCKHVIRNMGIKKPILVINHGVGNIFHPNSKLQYPRGEEQNDPFMFLHPCAAVFYPERKSTQQVFQAFQMLISAGYDVHLRVIFGRRTRQIKKLLDEVSNFALTKMDVIFQAGSRPLQAMADQYATCHALLAPSRAEGFGIMPLEARACGTPVIQTLCTGHADHFNDGESPANYGVQIVQHGTMSEAWGGFGSAPVVSKEAIFDAMVEFIERYPMLRARALHEAENVKKRWSWENVTMPLVEWIRANSITNGE